MTCIWDKDVCVVGTLSATGSIGTSAGPMSAVIGSGETITVECSAADAWVSANMATIDTLIATASTALSSFSAKAESYNLTDPCSSPDDQPDLPAPGPINPNCICPNPATTKMIVTKDLTITGNLIVQNQAIAPPSTPSLPPLPSNVIVELSPSLQWIADNYGNLQALIACYGELKNIL